MNWLLSYLTALGQQLAICGCFVLLISYLNRKIQSCDAKLPELFNLALSLQLFLRGEVDRVDSSLVKYLHQFKRQLLASVR